LNIVITYNLVCKLGERSKCTAMEFVTSATVRCDYTYSHGYLYGIAV
jgi:hypothetical protein